MKVFMVSEGKEESSRKQPERILVVEADDLLRSGWRLSLRKALGKDLSEEDLAVVKDREEALKVLRESERPFELLLINVIDPKGIELIRSLRNQQEEDGIAEYLQQVPIFALGSEHMGQALIEEVNKLGCKLIKDSNPNPELIILNF